MKRLTPATSKKGFQLDDFCRLLPFWYNKCFTEITQSSYTISGAGMYVCTYYYALLNIQCDWLLMVSCYDCMKFGRIYAKGKRLHRKQENTQTTGIISLTRVSQIEKWEFFLSVRLDPRKENDSLSPETSPTTRTISSSQSCSFYTVFSLSHSSLSTFFNIHFCTSVSSYFPPLFFYLASINQCNFSFHFGFGEHLCLV